MPASRNTRLRRNTGASRTRQAFTLVEVMLALGIMGLLTGVIYTIVSGTLHSTADLEEHENRTQEINGFLTLCRKSFHTMPASAIFEVRVVPEGNGYVQQLIFRNAPGLFWWGDQKNVSVSTIVEQHKQVGGLTSVGILQDSEDEITSYLNGGTVSRDWLVLLPDLRNAEWRFYDPRTTLWVKEWHDSFIRPSCVELTLANEDGTEKYLFWLPPVKGPQG